MIEEQKSASVGEYRPASYENYSQTWYSESISISFLAVHNNRLFTQCSRFHVGYLLAFRAQYG